MIAVDHKEPLPTMQNRNRDITSIIDIYSGYVESINARNTAITIMNHWIARHEVPKAILSDVGTELISKVVKELCRSLGIKKLQTTGYYGEGNGSI